jgi:hypothetical protein
MMELMKINIAEAFKGAQEKISDLLENLRYTEESDMFEVNELLESAITEAQSLVSPELA